MKTVTEGAQASRQHCLDTVTILSTLGQALPFWTIQQAQVTYEVTSEVTESLSLTAPVTQRWHCPDHQSAWLKVSQRQGKYDKCFVSWNVLSVCTES